MNKLTDRGYFPTAVYRGFCLLFLFCERNRYFFTRICPSPNGNRLALLKDHIRLKETV